MLFFTDPDPAKENSVEELFLSSSLSGLMIGIPLYIIWPNELFWLS